MTDILGIKNGSFRAEIILDNLPELPLANIKKLFKLMLKAPWENRDAIETLDNRIRTRIDDAKAHWEAAAWDYAAGYKIPRSKSRSDPESVAQRKKNRRLIQTVNSSKAQFEHWEKILTLYEKEKEL